MSLGFLILLPLKFSLLSTTDHGRIKVLVKMRHLLFHGISRHLYLHLNPPNFLQEI